MTVAEIFVRLSRMRADGRRVEVAFGMDPSETFEQLFVDAHCRSDGAEPTPADLGMNPGRWARAMALRDAECELTRLVEEP